MTDTADIADQALPWTDRDAAGRRAALTAMLAQVSREAAMGEGLEAVLQRIVDCLVRQLPVAIASIILLDEGGGQFIKEVWAGQLVLDLHEDGPWPVTVGAAGRCARQRAPQLITDVENDPDYVPGNLAVRSEYLVPILHRDRMHGVLNIESTHADFFSTEVCAVFDAVAAQVAGTIHLARLAQELEQANRRLRELSMQDGLTGIANRRCFDQRLAIEWCAARDARRPLALLLVDADCFKGLNDAAGHLYGDECLRELARQCEALASGCGGLAARYGGEELAVILPGQDIAVAAGSAERLRSAVLARKLSHPASSVARYVTVSIGVAAGVPTLPRCPSDLVAVADQALYAAKQSGRNRVESHPLA